MSDKIEEFKSVAFDIIDTIIKENPRPRFSGTLKDMSNRMTYMNQYLEPTTKVLQVAATKFANDNKLGTIDSNKINEINLAAITRFMDYANGK